MAEAVRGLLGRIAPAQLVAQGAQVSSGLLVEITTQVAAEAALGMAQTQTADQA